MKLLLLASLAQAAYLAQSPVQMRAAVSAYFGARGADPVKLRDTLLTLRDLDHSYYSAGQLDELRDAARAAADRAVYRGLADFAPADMAREVSDAQAEQALERSAILLRTPLEQFLTDEHRGHLARNERLYRQLLPANKADQIRRRMEAFAAILNPAAAVEPVPAPPVPARRPQPLTRPAAKPKGTPAWLRGPREKTGLEAEIDAERKTVQDLIKGLPATAAALADASIASKFASAQELAVATLIREGLLEEAERAAAASPFPHVQSMTRPRDGMSLFSPRKAARVLSMVAAGLTAAVSTSTAAAAVIWGPNWPLYFAALGAALLSVYVLDKMLK